MDRPLEQAMILPILMSPPFSSPYNRGSGDQGTRKHTPRLTDHGGAPCQSSLGALAKVVSRCHAQNRHLQPGVDIDATRQDQQPMSLNGSDATGDNEAFSELPANSIES